MKRYHANRNRLTLTILILSLFAGNWILKRNSPSKIDCGCFTNSVQNAPFSLSLGSLIHNLVNSNQYTVVESLSLTNGRLDHKS